MFSPVFPIFYSKTFIFCYTFFNIYQLNLTVKLYQISYPPYQKSYPTVTIVIIPTLLSDHHFPRKIRTYVNFQESKITTYDNFLKLKIITYRNSKRPAGASYFHSRSRRSSVRSAPRHKWCRLDAGIMFGEGGWVVPLAHFLVRSLFFGNPPKEKVL